jgi:hypothetical protein
MSLERFKQIKIDPLPLNGVFLTKRELKKLFPKIYESHRKNVLGAVWNHEERKLHVIIAVDSIEVWTYEF